MAGTTFTATLQPTQPRQMPDGISIATAKYVSASSSLSVSDVIKMLQLPEGAVIIDGYVSGAVGATGSLVIKCGIGGATSTDDDLISAVTISGTTKLTRFDGSAGLPYATPSVAAATYPKSNWVTITGVSGSTTASVSLQISVIYTTGNLTGLNNIY